jgi:Glu-tRNA(Gln) amidotransferase subunit E-like FAD-binding protein
MSDEQKAKAAWLAYRKQAIEAAVAAGESTVTLTDTFSFTVPEDSTHADAGKELEKSFEYMETLTSTAADKVVAEKKWNLQEMVNKALKQNGRANAYQNALAVYKPSEVSPDEIKARMVRDFIRLGLSEDVAKAQVDSILAANNG